MQPPRAVVVLPTHNERQSIGEIIARVLDQQDRVPDFTLNVLVVDGESSDGTIEHVQQLSHDDPRIHLLVVRRRGLGVALLQAYAHAVANLQPAYIAQMDADLSHDPNRLPALLAALGAGADLAIGSRYVAGGGTRGWPLSRRLESAAANKFIRFVTGHHELREWTSGYRAFTVQLYRRLDLPSISYDDYTVQPALVYAALVAGARVAEVPIVFVDRRWGKSKLPLFRYTFHLIRHFTRARLRSPATKGQTWPMQIPD